MVRVGQRLYDARLDKGLTIEEVARATKIRPQFIDALEKGEYTRLPSSAYVLGFVKNYIAFLGLPSKELLAMFRREYDRQDALNVLPQSFTNRKIERRTVRLGRVVGIGIALFLLLAGYAVYQSRYAFFDPPLHIDQPIENAHLANDIVVVSGKVSQDVLVYVNDTSVLVDGNGNFKKNISIFPGAETITIKAVNSFGRKTVIKRHVWVE